MTNDVKHQDMLDRINGLTELIAKAKIAEQYREIQHMKNETIVEYQHSLQKAEREIEELESTLEKLNIKIKAVNKFHNDKIESLTKYKGEIALNDIELDRAQLSSKDLEAQVKAKEQELEKEQQAELSSQYENQESLPLVIYEGMGIGLPLDPDGRVRKAVLRSDQHDLLSLALEDGHTYQIATRIWEFISK